MLLPVAVAFIVFGGFWGSWAVSTADVESQLGLSHGGFGALLSVALAGAAVANALVGTLTERWGTSRALSVSLLAWSLALLGGAVVPGRIALCVALVATVAAGGAVDVVMNAAATAGLAGDPGRLVRFHGLFNAGAAVGAVGVGAVIGAGATWRWAWAIWAAAAAATAVWVGRSALPAGERGERTSLLEAWELLRREGLVLVAVAFAVGAMVEGGIETWGVLYLRERLASGILVGTAAAALGYVVAMVARVSLGPFAGRLGATRGVAVGAGIAAAGLVVMSVAPVAGIAAAGLVVAAGGISMCWPLLLAAATAGRPRPGIVVGSVSAIGYLGFVVGPAVVGWLSRAIGLRGGLLLLAAAAVFVAVAPSRRPGASVPRHSPVGP